MLEDGLRNFSMATTDFFREDMNSRLWWPWESLLADRLAEIRDLVQTLFPKRDWASLEEICFSLMVPFRSEDVPAHLDDLALLLSQLFKVPLCTSEGPEYQRSNKRNQKWPWK